MKLVSVEQMKAIENAADKRGTSYAAMMENAGRAVAEVIAQRLNPAGPVLVLVGPGNNGGDGLVTARHLKEKGFAPVLYIWKRDTKQDENYELTQQLEIPAVWAEKDRNREELQHLLRNAGVVVDALLGTGASRPIEGTLSEILDLTASVRRDRRIPPKRSIARLNGIPERGDGLPEPLCIVAVDVPSGLDCTMGRADPHTLTADITVTFAYPKLGQFSPEACDLIGELLVADIGIPADLAEAKDISTELVTADMVAALLPARPRSSHKGTYGKALIVAGSVNYTGAAYLAATSASHVGAGLVTLGIPRPLQPALAAKISEATYLLLPHEIGVLNRDAATLVLKRMSDYEALLVGPGLTSEKEAVSFVHELLKLKPSPSKGHLGFINTAPEAESASVEFPPLVLDADGLNALQGTHNWWELLPGETILTPHPGEMSRLLGRSTAEIQAARLETAREAALTWGHIVVLKGAHTVVAHPGGQTFVNPFANPALATAGTGDVLAGLIVGLLSQGLRPLDAAVAAVYIHGLCGELARQEIGPAGAVAEDIASRVPSALRLLRQT